MGRLRYIFFNNSVRKESYKKKHLAYTSHYLYKEV